MSQISEKQRRVIASSFLSGLRIHFRGTVLGTEKKKDASASEAALQFWNSVVTQLTGFDYYIASHPDNGIEGTDLLMTATVKEFKDVLSSSESLTLEDLPVITLQQQKMTFLKLLKFQVLQTAPFKENHFKWGVTKFVDLLEGKTPFGYKYRVFYIEEDDETVFVDFTDELRKLLVLL